MTDWQRKIAPYVRAIERRYDALKYRLYYALGGPGPIRIQPYHGYGTPERFYLMGRVLEDRGVAPPSETDSWWTNLINMVKRLQSREVPHAHLIARFQDVEQTMTADEEGMFECVLEPSQPVSSDKRWQSVELELVEPVSEGQPGPVRATAPVLIPPPDAPFGVISDIDDTVIQSDVGDFLQMLGTVLFGNARTRLPLPGVAAFYRALHRGPHGDAKAPMFYVSNGLWNLYDLLEDFFRMNNIPGGPVLLLRNWGVYRDEILPTRQREHKLGLIRPILDTYADLPFILLGDSSEADPEIYCTLVDQHPDRILAVYIRTVSPDPERARAIRALAQEVAAAGRELVLADDSLSMARHAARKGWIPYAALSDVAAAQLRDQSSAASAGGSYPSNRAEKVIKGRGGLEEGAVRAILEDATEGEAPTVIVQSDGPD